MKQLIIKAFLLALLNALLGLLVLAVNDSRYHFQQYETDSILLSTPKNTHFDVVVLGTSRARLLTRVRCNLECLERELGRTFGLAIPFGGGIVPERLFLDNFFSKGNEADTIVYFLDAFQLFAPQPNREHRFVYYEPLRLRFLWQMMRNGFPPERIFTYVQSKFTYRWFTQAPGEVGCIDRVLTPDRIDPETMKKRVDSLYFEGLSETYFRRYARDLECILDTARSHGSRVLIAFPPTLLGPQPGADRLKKELEALRNAYTFEFFDFTDAVTDINLYYDYDHLNGAGVEQFVTKHLKPALGKADTQ